MGAKLQRPARPEVHVASYDVSRIRSKMQVGVLASSGSRVSSRQRLAQTPSDDAVCTGISGCSQGKLFVVELRRGYLSYINI